MFIYKDGLTNSGEERSRQVLDYITEGVNQVGGSLELDSQNKPDSYTFNITDYISELLEGTTNDLPKLGVRVINPTDLPVSAIDTIVRNHNWNPKAIMLLNHNTQDASRKAKLTIAYTVKTDEN